MARQTERRWPHPVGNATVAKLRLPAYDITIRLNSNAGVLVLRDTDLGPQLGHIHEPVHSVTVKNRKFSGDILSVLANMWK